MSSLGRNDRRIFPAKHQ